MAVKKKSPRQLVRRKRWRFGTWDSLQPIPAAPPARSCLSHATQARHDELRQTLTSFQTPSAPEGESVEPRALTQPPPLPTTALYVHVWSSSPAFSRIWEQRKDRRLATAGTEISSVAVVQGEKVVPNGWHSIGNERHERGVREEWRGKLMECGEG